MGLGPIPNGVEVAAFVFNKEVRVGKEFILGPAKGHQGDIAVAHDAQSNRINTMVLIRG